MQLYSQCVEEDIRKHCEFTLSCLIPKPVLDLCKASTCSAFSVCCQQPNLLGRSVKKAAERLVSCWRHKMGWHLGALSPCFPYEREGMLYSCNVTQIHELLRNCVSIPLLTAMYIDFFAYSVFQIDCIWQTVISHLEDLPQFPQEIHGIMQVNIFLTV